MFYSDGVERFRGRGALCGVGVAEQDLLRRRARICEMMPVARTLQELVELRAASCSSRSSRTTPTTVFARSGVIGSIGFVGVEAMYCSTAADAKKLQMAAWVSSQSAACCQPLAAIESPVWQHNERVAARTRPNCTIHKHCAKTAGRACWLECYMPLAPQKPRLPDGRRPPVCASEIDLGVSPTVKCRH